MSAGPESMNFPPQTLFQVHRRNFGPIVIVCPPDTSIGVGPHTRVSGSAREVLGMLAHGEPAFAIVRGDYSATLHSIVINRIDWAREVVYYNDPTGPLRSRLSAGVNELGVQATKSDHTPNGYTISFAEWEICFVAAPVAANIWATSAGVAKNRRFTLADFRTFVANEFVAWDVSPISGFRYVAKGEGQSLSIDLSTECGHYQLEWCFEAPDRTKREPSRLVRRMVSLAEFLHGDFPFQSLLNHLSSGLRFAENYYSTVFAAVLARQRASGEDASWSEVSALAHQAAEREVTKKGFPDLASIFGYVAGREGSGAFVSDAVYIRCLTRDIESRSMGVVILHGSHPACNSMPVYHIEF